MSFAITAIVLTGVSTAVGARGQYLAGKSQEIAYNEQAEAERIQAQAQELQRRERLNEALAQNVVGQSMAGITGEGTPASLALTTAESIGLSEGIIESSERLRRAALKRAGRNAKAVGNLQSFGTLLSGATRMASLASLDSGAPNSNGNESSS